MVNARNVPAEEEGKKDLFPNEKILISGSFSDTFAPVLPDFLPG